MCHFVCTWMDGWIFLAETSPKICVCVVHGGFSACHMHEQCV